MPHRHGWRRRDARAVYEAHAGPNMTPMVDVVMVILIFFMASTVIVGPELLLRAGLDPDTAAPADPRFAIQEPVFTLTLRLEGSRVLAGGLGLRDADPRQIEAAARSLAGEVDPARVEIAVDPGDAVPYEAVIAAQDAVMRAGFTTVALR